MIKLDQYSTGPDYCLWQEQFASLISQAYGFPFYNLTNETESAIVSVPNKASSMEIDVSGITDKLVFFSKGTVSQDYVVDKKILGGKGAGLIEMVKLGLPVPPGVIIPTEICKEALEMSNPDIIDDAAQAVAGIVRGVLSEIMGMSGTDGEYPMVSVRSGAQVSMPGMMDTILNVGITKNSLMFWSKQIGTRAALDSYRRLIQMYGQTAMDIEPKRFHSAMKEVMQSKYGHAALPESENSLSVKHLEKLIEKYEAVYKAQTGDNFPQTLE